MDVSKHNWAERDEKVLLDCVGWVEESFPKGSETLASLGGKWEVVSIRMKNSGLSISNEACKSRFFKIKRREQRQVKGGKKIVTLLDTDFPQADVKTPHPSDLTEQPAFVNLQRRVSYLEDDVASLKKKAAAIMELNDNMTKFFDTFGIKVPKRDL